MIQTCIPTGVSALDSAMSGGINEGDSVLFVTENSIDGARLMQTLMLSLRETHKKTLYITSKKSAASLIDELKNRCNISGEIESCILDAGVLAEDAVTHVLEKIAALPAGCVVFLDSLTSYIPFAELNFPLFFQKINKAMRDFSEKKIACIFMISAGALSREHEVCFTDLFTHVWRLKRVPAEDNTIRILSIESTFQDANLAPREELQLSASLLPDGTVELVHLRKIR